MSDVSVWSLFAYMTDDEEGKLDEHRRPTEWQLPDVLRWCLARGYDNILFSRDPIETTGFQRGSEVPVLHHMHLVERSKHEHGDDAA